MVAGVAARGFGRFVIPRWLTAQCGLIEWRGQRAGSGSGCCRYAFRGVDWSRTVWRRIASLPPDNTAAAGSEIVVHSPTRTFNSLVCGSVLLSCRGV